MVKYYEVEGRIIKLANDEITPTFHCYISVDNYTLIEEDGVFNNQEVHKGDAVAILYDRDENGNRRYFIFDKDSVIAKRTIAIKEEHNKKCKDCECSSPGCECTCSDKA